MNGLQACIYKLAFTGKLKSLKKFFDRLLLVSYCTRYVKVKTSIIELNLATRVSTRDYEKTYVYKLVTFHRIDAWFTKDPANKPWALKAQIRIATISSQTTFQLPLLQISIELRHGHRYGYKQVAASGYGSPDGSLKKK